MKRNLRFFYLCCFLAFSGLINTAQVHAQTSPELKHSYTFEDGTDGVVTDVAGGANGTVEGGVIADGAYTAAANGDHVELPADKIAINTYSAITLEAYITAGNGANNSPNNNFTMLAYFGGTHVNGDGANMGANGYFMSVARGLNEGIENSRTAISTGSEDTPYSVEDGVDGPELEDGAPHHLVSVLANDSIWWYIDGVRQGAALIREGRSISDLSNDLAMLAKGGYLGDPTWLGSIHEFNIYEGKMSAEEVAKKAATFIPVLKHSYTFEDGTDGVVTDVVGGANGTVEGGTIADGTYTTAADGDHIELPADEIAINTYSAITLEAYITAGNGANNSPNNNFTMLAYFGGTHVNGDGANMGANGYFMSVARGLNEGVENSRTAISTGSEDTPYSVEDGVDGPELEDGAPHHLVSVLTNDSIYWYIDGERQGAALIREGRSISDLSNDLAMLAKGGYLGDPTWLGSIHEFNIYEGKMSAEEVAKKAATFIPVLKHSYTFEDGTDGVVTDVVGGANGTVEGGTIADGTYTTAADGDHIELPADEIAINTYSAITLEAYITAGNGANNSPNNNFTMLAYFGGTHVNGDGANMGANGYFMSVARGLNEGVENSRTAISTGSEDTPYSVEDGVDGPELEDGAPHHLVSVLTNDSIYWYIDGERQGAALIREGRSISDLSNDLAMLAKGGYLGDPTWLGSIHEFNIYEGKMSAETVAERRRLYLGDPAATLAELTVTAGEEEEVVIDPEFSPETDTYTIKVPRGTTSVTIAATPTNSSATVEGTGEVTLENGSAIATLTVTTAQGATMDYTLEIREFSNDASLAAITFADENLSIEFDPAVKEYTVEVPQGTTAVTVNASPSQSGAETEGTGSVELDGGMGTATIKVTAEDGTEDTYIVNFTVEGVKSDARLASLKVHQGPLTPEFDPEVTEYTVSVPFGYPHVYVVANPMVRDAEIEGDEAVSLADGNNTVTVAVTSMDGTSTRTYTITVNELAPTGVEDELNELVKVFPTLSTGEFNVQFAGNTGKVTVYDPSGKVVVEKSTAASEAVVTLSKAGLYIFHIESKGVSKKIKAIVAK